MKSARALVLALALGLLSLVVGQQRLDPPPSFWYNSKTGASQLDRPRTMPIRSQAHDRDYWVGADGKSQWEPLSDCPWRVIKPAGGATPYFYSEKNKKTTWDAPECLAWVKMYSGEEHKYYYNSVTGASQRERPEILGYEDKEKNATYYKDANTGEATWNAPKDAAWKAVEDAKTKRTYFTNSLTKESLWTKPNNTNLDWVVFFDPIEDSVNEF
jgi:hypothetical protein